ncbi:gliding motility-associated C-terminal domain-containing protein [Emticicia sp. SJ17W-69]|uniref:T9SS type B sorting domain-containing protein n=1 Tax=Emticicia sp. SJ17W-69 TaxID=3421657 RepID=UPI003EB8D117
MKKTLHIILLIGLSTIASFCQVLNDQCNGPNIGSGSLYAEKMIGCVPFTLRIIKTDTQSTGHKFIYDYKGGIPANLVEEKSHSYTAPGAYKVLQSSFRKDNGQELRVCGIVTVLDTNKLILKPKICGNKVSLEITDGKKAGLLPYDYCLIDWGDASAIEKVNLPSTAVSHNYANQTDKKITVTGRYEVDFCPSSNTVLITFPKATQPQITVLEKTGKDNFNVSFNNYSGENIKVLANNVAITSKTGEVGLQKISFTNTAKNVCYAIQLESACFANNISKEVCDIDLEVIPTENSNEVEWKKPKPDVIKDFVLIKNNGQKLSPNGIAYADTAIKCNQQNCYQISFHSNESLFISEKICVQNSLIKCFVNVSLYLPLAFSPNNDGINDTFGIIGEHDKFISLTIFDHLGKLITVLTNPNDTWNGESYLSGIYPYKLKAKDAKNNEIEVLGKVLLLR